MSSYCGIIECNCKYHDEEEGCLFYAYGSGEEEDKPCYRDDEDEEDE